MLKLTIFLLTSTLLTASHAFANNDTISGNNAPVNTGVQSGNFTTNISTVTQTTTSGLEGAKIDSSTDSSSNSHSSSNSKSNANAYSGSSNATTNISSNTPHQAPAILMPALTAGTNPCSGSASIGGSGAVFGFSLGKTTHDKNCEVRAMAAELAALGYQEPARQLLCQDKRVAQSFAAAGQPCDRPLNTVSLEEHLDNTPIIVSPPRSHPHHVKKCVKTQ